MSNAFEITKIVLFILDDFFIIFDDAVAIHPDFLKEYSLTEDDSEALAKIAFGSFTHFDEVAKAALRYDETEDQINSAFRQIAFHLIQDKILNVAYVYNEDGYRIYMSPLQYNYDSFEEFERYSETYSLAKRLGFSSAKEAWDTNPVVTHSTDPNNYMVYTS